MAQLTKQALIVENNQSFPNNNAGAITPTVLRQFNTDIIDSTVNQSVYTADSGSWNEKIDGLSTGSALITASVDFATITFTKGDGSQFDLVVTASVASVDWDNVTDKPAGLVSGSSQVVDILTSVNSFTASQEEKDSTLASYTGSVDTKFATIGTQSGSWENVPLTSLNAFTQSQESKDVTLASYTGSVNQKFSTIGTQSGSWDNSSLNQFSASQESKDITLASYTGSVNTKFSTIGSQSGSWDNTALNQFTQSQDITNTHLLLASNSFEAKFSTIGSQSGSWVTESETGSFARTNVANTFTETQQFGNVNVTGTANIHILNVTYESSSVIYSSGSNQFGDELTDTQTLSGSVKVVGGLTVNGINVLTSSVDLGPLNQFTASQDILNDTFATTGSNQFNGNQNIIGQLTASALRVENNTHLDGTLTVTNDTLINGDVTIQSATPNLKLRDTSGGGFSSGYDLRVDTGSFEIYDDTHDRDVLSDVFNPSTSKHTTSLTSQIVLISGSDSVTIQGNLTASLQNGYAWVGNGSGLTSQVPTSSFGGTTNLGPLNSFTQSQEATNTQLLNASSSFESKFAYIGTQSGSWSGGGTDLGPLNSFTSSQQILNAQFATTGSNTFNGTEIVNGLVTQNVTAPATDTQKDFISVSGATINGSPYNYVNVGLVNYPSFGNGYTNAFITEYYDSLSYNYGAEFIVNGGRIGGTLTASGSSSPASFRIQDQYDGTTFGNFYADEIQFGEFASGTRTRIGIGHTALPLLEIKANDIIITGSVTISGSMNSSVIPLTITSNTASLNASSGSTFQLNLVSGSATRLEVSGTTSGQTINLLVSQSATGPGTLVFGSGIEQPSGSFYSASQVANGEDIITMATFINPGRLYLANIKNFI